jgi:hypothetical protein
MDRSFQGEDGSLAGCCCGRSCGQAASAKKAAGENDPSAALDLLQSLWIGAEPDPGKGNGKACDGLAMVSVHGSSIGIYDLVYGRDGDGSASARACRRYGRYIDLS